MKALRVAATVIALLLAGSCDDFTGPDQDFWIELLNIPWAPLRIGTTVQLDANVRPIGGGLPLDVRVTWSSTNETVATVDSTGLVTARNVGSTDITAAARNTATSVTLGVVGPPARVAVDPGQITAVVSGSFHLFATVFDAYGTVLYDTVTWTSSDPAVLAVERQGPGDARVTVLATGTATVTATADPASGSATITAETVTFTRLAAGGQHTCGVSTARAWCWGSPATLGSHTVTFDTSVPVLVADTPLVDVTAGLAHACGRTPEGRAVCWGDNNFGALGREGFDRGPGWVATTATFTALGAGATHTCGLTGTGEVLCWGGNGSGQLGGATARQCGGGKYLPAMSCSPAPVRATGLPPLVAVAAGGTQTCGLEADGRIRCWGAGPGVLRDSIVRFRSITAGSEHTCGITAGGAAMCWGANHEGQLGDGSVVPRDAVTPVASGTAFVSLHAGTYHTCGLTADGDAYCWGGNARGALGDGTIDRRLLPVAVSGGHRFVTLSPGAHHTCGVDTDGVTYCWGSNVSGQLGVTGEDSPAPVRVRGQP